MASIFFPLTLIIFATSTSFSVSVLVLLLSGFTIVTFLATANSLIQLSVTDELRGRIMGVYFLVFLGMAPIGHLVIGILADTFGTGMALVLSGVLCLLTGGVYGWNYLRGQGQAMRLQ
jgi:MFS family permease